MDDHFWNLSHISQHAILQVLINQNKKWEVIEQKYQRVLTSKKEMEYVILIQVKMQLTVETHSGEWWQSNGKNKININTMSLWIQTSEIVVSREKEENKV